MANSAQTITASLPETGGAPRFECRFEYTSTSVCTLSRCKGSRLFINGLNEAIPSAGVTLANSSLASNDTNYYVYAYMSGGTMTLETSGTAYATDSTYGHNIKSGDGTRTLVGMVRKTGGNFVWTGQTKWVMSFYNRQPVMAIYQGAFTTFTSTAWTYVSSSHYTDHLTWAGEVVHISVHNASYGVSGSPTYAGTGIGVNGTSLNFGGTYHAQPANNCSSLSAVSTPSEGRNYYYALSVVDTGGVAFQNGTGLVSWTMG